MDSIQCGRNPMIPNTEIPWCNSAPEHLLSLELNLDRCS
jgi:hypothetical protein